MLTVYGIGSCDTCRRARKYLADNGIEYRFHDVREDGLDARMLKRWTSRLDWTLLVNKKSLTWRKVPEVDRSGINENSALALLIANPTLLKRPVLESDGFIAVGFNEQRFAEIWEADG